MKVYYISNVFDGTGWSHAAISYMLALDAAGIEVVSRHIKLNDVQGEVPEKILEFESRNPRGSDIVIQNLLPHHMDRAAGIKNVGLCFLETSNCKVSSWPSKLNTMDAIITSNGQGATAMKDSGVNTDLFVFGIPCDPKKYEIKVEPFKFPGLEDTFKFYFIGESVRRKNIAALIKAFELEFSPNEPVSLVLKVSYPGVNSQQAQQNLKQFIQEIRNGLKIRRQQSNILTITSRLSEVELNRLHQTCDCFVMPSFGESWSIPAQDAMGFGRPVITTEGIGTNEFVDNENGWLIPSFDVPAFGFNETFGDIHTGVELVKEISIPKLRQAMREAFENKELYNKKSIASADDIKTAWNYEVCGQNMEWGLETCLA